jgi:hypothetical protein
MPQDINRSYKWRAFACWLPPPTKPWLVSSYPPPRTAQDRSRSPGIEASADALTSCIWLPALMMTYCEDRFDHADEINRRSY